MTIDEKIRRARQAWELGARINIPTPLRPIPPPRPVSEIRGATR